MIYTGLCSVTFRKLSPDVIVRLVVKAGLQGIEWGGDIHVPSGDVRQAVEVSKMTNEMGLIVSSYGSYYTAANEKNSPDSFERVLETAVALKAPTIRVWAGGTGSRDTNEALRMKIADDLRRIAVLAEIAGVGISLEYHRNSLTDTPESAIRLLKDIDRKNVRTYWQLLEKIDVHERLSGLDQIKQWISNIHVYAPSKHESIPLSDGMTEWREYLEIVKKIEGDRFCLLEFVKDDSEDQFLQDAETLKCLISKINVLHYNN